LSGKFNFGSYQSITNHTLHELQIRHCFIKKKLIIEHTDNCNFIIKTVETVLLNKEFIICIFISRNLKENDGFINSFHYVVLTEKSVDMASLIGGRSSTRK
jgi:hypothetical protein